MNIIKYLQQLKHVLWINNKNRFSTCCYFFLLSTHDQYSDIYINSNIDIEQEQTVGSFRHKQTTVSSM